MIEAATEVPLEIEVALHQLGVTPLRIVLVSPLKQNKGPRCAYRVETDDGRTLKARQVDTPDEARRLVELRAGLEKAFAPALARYDCVLLEEWIEGTPLTALESEARAEEAGALLGRLHARPLDADVPAMLPTRKWIERAMSDLKILGGGGKLAPSAGAALRAEIVRRDPGAARAAVVHQDFCAENMLIDAGGHLRVIDNERLAIAPAGFDVGRTFDRWPMSAAAWARFRRGYRSAAPADIQSISFWKILAALMGARVRFQRSPARLEAALAVLRRFADGEGLSEP
jgi:Ser/Thr protein kinase RdoA (MazF antagonist)